MTSADWPNITRNTRLAMARFSLSLARETGNAAELAFARQQLAELEAELPQKVEDDNGRL